MSYMYIKALAAQQGYKTLTVNMKQSTEHKKNLEKSTELSEFF